MFEQASGEIKFNGLATSPGISIAKAHIVQRAKPDFDAKPIEEHQIESEIQKYLRAREQVVGEMDLIQKQNEENQGIDDSLSAILSAQMAILLDPEFDSQVQSIISEKLNCAAFAIYQVMQIYVDLMKRSNNPLMNERILDMEQMRDKLVISLQEEDINDQIPNDCIIVAREFWPHELLKYADRIKGVVTEKGGKTSHLAIISQALRIPSVFGAHQITEKVNVGDLIVVNGINGSVSVRPSGTSLKEAKMLIDDYHQTLNDLELVIQQKSNTRCGHPFHLLANVELREEVDAVSKYGCEGIGLLRTETLLMQSKDGRNIDQQTAYLKHFLASNKVKELTVRLFDAGGDKLLGSAYSESNPFLGWRGIRFLLDQRSLLDDQIESILIASGDYPDKLKILVPMISTLDELRLTKKRIQRVKEKLDEKGVKYDKNIPLGIMIEVPSTALLACAFAKEVDFFSIGTNDLTQYTLAVDRGNDFITSLYQQEHPAIWYLIAQSTKAATEANIPISVCGEMASEPILAACLVGMGVDTLSMSPQSLPYVKQMLINSTLKDMQDLAKNVLNCTTTAEVKEVFHSFLSTN